VSPAPSSCSLCWAPCASLGGVRWQLGSHRKAYIRWRVCVAADTLDVDGAHPPFASSGGRPLVPQEGAEPSPSSTDAAQQQHAALQAQQQQQQQLQQLPATLSLSSLAFEPDAGRVATDWADGIAAYRTVFPLPSEDLSGGTAKVAEVAAALSLATGSHRASTGSRRSRGEVSTIERTGIVPAQVGGQASLLFPSCSSDSLRTLPAQPQAHRGVNLLDLLLPPTNTDSPSVGIRKSRWKSGCPSMRRWQRSCRSL
jgi:hypothetical protein